MNYQEITDKKSVTKAIKEFDRLGRNAFLKKYGFGKARSYFLLYRGKYYDSKAIVGAAHKYEHGIALTHNDFSGGKNTVLPKLEKLGFQVIALELDERTAAFAEEVPESLWEGARVPILVNKFERSYKARIACIEHHGAVCKVCGFDFGSSYGDDFKGFIHVHHLVPLSKIDERYEVNPLIDLVPVCANCHAAIHYGNKVRKIDEVKLLVNSARSGKKSTKRSAKGNQ